MFVRHSQLLLLIIVTVKNRFKLGTIGCTEMSLLPDLSLFLAFYSPGTVPVVFLTLGPRVGAEI